MIRGLVGKSLGYSYSKEINEIINCSPYVLFNVSNIDDFIDEFKNKKETFSYFNITIPYKKAVIHHLDFMDEITKSIGACNLIVNVNKQLYGFNTDYYAFEKMLQEEEIDVKEKEILVLGTGGSSQMVDCYLRKHDAGKVLFASRKKTGLNVVIYDELQNNTNKALKIKQMTQIIINCTPIGTYPNFLEKIINVKEFNNLEVVIDIVYNPYRTRLLQEASDEGLRTCNGLKMLIYQAILSNYIYDKELYNNISSLLIDSLDVEKYHYAIIEKALKEKRNIILIGMSGVGKTTIAQKLGECLHRRVYDTDKMIETKYGRINEIFENKSEDCFRLFEREMVTLVSQEYGCIIATGGGVINDDENMKLLKANGIIFYLERDIDKILVDDNHPLVRSEEEKRKLFNKRQKIYEQYSDVKIINNEIDTTIKKIIEKIKTY